MIAREDSDVGAMLDEHHAPETNGRMPVCRRCGSTTDAAVGAHHTPDASRTPRLVEWLDAQARMRHFEEARQRLLASPEGGPSGR